MFNFFKPKSNCEEYLKLIDFKRFLDGLLNKDCYISKKDYLCEKNKILPIIEMLQQFKSQSVFFDWCKKNKLDAKEITAIISSFELIDESIKNHNNVFVNNHLVKDKEYLDNVLVNDDPAIILDEEQRRVVLSDEDYTLIIAGAGAGKTTTIEAKVKYLVDKKNISPKKILIVSFTRKATNELKERIGKLGIDPIISTFHSIGNAIIKNNELSHHRVVSMGRMFDIVKDFMITKLDDEYFIKKILLFFASYLSDPFSNEEISSVYKNMSDENITTIKEDIKDILNKYQQQSTEKHITIKEERVRSADECKIANFLYINGIEYEYEPIYEYGFEDSIKPYCPDFVIKQGDRKIYLEHFGISEDGKNARFSEEELKIYKKHINDKILLHRKHKTNLIYTFSKYNDGRDLITHLKELLKEESIELDTRHEIEIYRQIAKNAEDKYFTKLTMLICNFINKFKVNNFTPSKFDEWKAKKLDERTKLFIEITYQCYLIYARTLKEENAIDFEDMINNASNILDEKIKNHEKIDFDYIFVDEYQDISLQRFNLCEKLAKASNAKIVAVGDDWQSIFRFSGAKIDLFTNFEKMMGYANIMKITKTYRNSQELIDIAGGFIMKNEQQFKKRLVSNKSIDEPVILMSYDDSPKEKNNIGDKGPFYRMGEAIEKALDHAVQQKGINQKILLIGRYGFDGKNLSKLDDFFLQSNSSSKIISKKYPKLNLTFLTAHSSKGLGYDNVILINGKDAVLGFPSKIEDDPVMKLVIKDDEQIDFAEERRLFYVALTRTKNRTYIITPQNHPSKFILEIQKAFTMVVLRGVKLTPCNELEFRNLCPICHYPLQKRTTSRYSKNNKYNTIWVCSNDPEVCGFLTNDLRGGKLSISKCPKCEDGFLVVKKSKNNSRFLGCTNYKEDGTGCNYILNQANYTQDKILLENSLSNGVDIDKLTIFNVKIKDLVANIVDTLKYAESKSFKFSLFDLACYLNGEETKSIKAFKLLNYKTFGLIKNTNRRMIYKLICCLRDVDILKIDEAEYNHLTLINNSISDDLLIDLYSRYI